MSAFSGRRSSHSTMACDQCFRLKVRCDGASPCASCSRLQQRCTYLRQDKRKISKASLAQLVERIRLLENALNQHKIPLPSSSRLEARSPEDLEHMTLASDTFTLPLPSQEQSLAGDVTQTEDADRERALIEGIDREPTLGQGLDPDLELLVKRTGSLQFAGHGQLQYFGTTPNAEWFRTTIPFHPRDRDSTDGDTAEAWLDRAGVGHPVTRDFEDHLIRLYFAWQNPHFHVVEYDAFMRARQQAISSGSPGRSGDYLTACYSDLLVNAICSFGALFTDKKIPGLPTPLHDFFISRARALLERDIDNPTIATVQALAMMSGSEASKGRDSRGWLYDSMASRLAHHLGLHLDVEHCIRSNDMPLQEANVRSTAFWGTYVIDQAWSYYLGRVTMPVADVNRIPVRTPDRYQPGTIRFWENYTDEAAEFEFPIERHIDPVASVWEHQLKLCFIMEQLQKAFYDKRTGSITQLRLHTASVTLALEKWLTDLPPELAVDTNSASEVYLPHILVLHAQYHEAMIFANHPFIITMPTTGQSSESRRKYVDSARKITQLLRIYKRLWSLRRMNIHAIHYMFTASMVHLYIASTCKSRDAHAQAVCDLETCCDSVREVSKPFELAAWQLRSIDRVRQIWYDMLENQSPGQELPSSEDVGLQGRERWGPIEAAIQKAMAPGDSGPSTEEGAWLNTWIQMESISGVDPFSMGFA